LERIPSCFPLRCMMFLNCEWPAMAPLIRSICWEWAPYTGEIRPVQGSTALCKAPLAEEHLTLIFVASTAKPKETKDGKLH
jgi:hypothetical protein